MMEAKDALEKIKDIAIELIADTAGNGTRENASFDLEYIRGIVDLYATIEERFQK